MSAVTPVSPELRSPLRRPRLGPVLDTLPERLALARGRSMPHAEFLELLLADGVTRRDGSAAARRAAAAGLDPAMTLERWDEAAAVRYDRALWAELTSLRFCDAAADVIVLGPVGVGRTHLASALGHIAVRRRRSVLIGRTDRIPRRLRAARLDALCDAELRRLLRVDVPVLDGFALAPLDATETADVHELVVERLATRWRTLNGGATVMALVLAGERFVDGILVRQPPREEERAA